MKYIIVLNLFFFSILNCALGQRREVKTLSASKRKEVAINLIKQGGYYAAIDHFKELLVKEPDNQDYMFRLAESYFNSRDYKNSEIWYAKLTENKDLSKKKKANLSIAAFRYGESLKYNAKYDQAREVFDIFANSGYKETKGENYRSWAKNEVLSCEFALSNKDRLKYVEVINMDSNINSGYSDFAPRLKNDSTLVYSSIQEDSVITVRHGDKHFEHTKIYNATLKDSLWQMPEEQPNVNSIFEHSANGAYSAFGKRFYLTRCHMVKGKMKCKIYVSDSTKKGLSKPKKLKGVNHATHTFTQPFSAKIKGGKTEQEILYFVSDMKGGNGGTDIWYSMIDKDGNASKPVNAGRAINTPRDEVSPYYDSESGNLYFSSNYHFGFGGYDVFRAQGSGNKFSKPENMFKPVNSNLDDTYYTLNKKDKFKGFIVSNRPGGFALLSETCCDDIYTFSYRQPTVMVLNITDSITGKVINDVKISVKSTRYPFNTPDSLIFNTASEEMDNLEVQTDQTFLDNLRLAQNPSSFYVLETNNIIEIAADANNYHGARAYVKTDNKGIIDSLKVLQGGVKQEGTPRFVTMNIVLGKDRPKSKKNVSASDTVRLASSLKKEFENSIKKAAKVEKEKKEVVKDKKEVSVPAKKLVAAEFILDLHFVFDKTEIVESDQVELDSIVAILKTNPDTQMEFTTHTDAIGSDEYNMKLSYRRAAFINNYIVRKGVSQRRVSGKGYGETKHIAPNTNPDGTDDPIGRQKNRRTDIKLISKD